MNKIGFDVNGQIRKSLATQHHFSTVKFKLHTNTKDFSCPKKSTVDSSFWHAFKKNKVSLL